MHEREHGALERALLHLPVGNGNRRLRHQLPEPAGDRVDVLHPVVHEEHLAAAAELAQDRVAHDGFVVARHVGADRQPIERRRLDDAQIADAGECHVQRARDRGCGQRQHVDGGAELTDALLVAHPETMLLVHDEQPEPLERDVLLEEPVRADHDVEPAGAQLLDRPLVLDRRLEPGQHADAHRIAREPRDERLEVLLGEDSGRHQHGHLLALEHGEERGPHRDLGLAEADVPAHQAVHRLLAGEVREHVVDRALLVGRLLERKARHELAVEAVGSAVRRPAVRLARRVHVEQLLRHREDRLARLRLDALPGAAAEFVERRRRGVGAQVALHQVDAVDGEIEAVAARILEVQVVAFRVRDLHVP